jgi:single-strand DNA-binding protein
MYQKYVIVGRLTKDGENRFLPNGTQVYKNSIASDRKYKKQDGSIATEVMYMDFSAFGGLANTMNTYLHKGSLCLLEGYIQFEQWTAQDGSTRSRHSLRVETMKMLDSKGSESNNTYNPNHQPGASSSQAESNHNYQSPGAMDRKLPEIDIDEDEIPF